jgi:hypothetical protein
VWYGNGLYDNNNIDSSLFDDPSWGSKGRILVADANPDPFVVDDADVGPRQIGERRSAFDGAYTLDDRPAFDLHSNLDQVISDTVTTVPAGMAKSSFRDRIGTYPGVFDNAFIDYDAGVVLPTVDQVPYWAYWNVFGDLGNPGLNAFGVNLEVIDQAPDGSWATIKFWLDDDTVFVDARARTYLPAGNESATYTISLKDASGTRYADEFNFTFDAALLVNLPEGVALAPGDLQLQGNGRVFFGPEVSAAAAERGIAIPSADSNANNFLWTGTLGGNRLGEPDAVLEFTVPLNSGCFTEDARLYIIQETIEDTFRNGGLPFLWPKHDHYVEELPLACVANQIFLPSVHRAP